MSLQLSRRLAVLLITLMLSTMSAPRFIISLKMRYYTILLMVFKWGPTILLENLITFVAVLGVSEDVAHLNFIVSGYFNPNQGCGRC